MRLNGAERDEQTSRQTNRPTDRDTSRPTKRTEMDSRREPATANERRSAGHVIRWWMVEELSRPVPVRRIPDHHTTQLRNYFDAVSCPLLSPKQIDRRGVLPRPDRPNLLSILAGYVGWWGRQVRKAHCLKKERCLTPSRSPSNIMTIRHTSYTVKSGAGALFCKIILPTRPMQ